MVICLQLHCHCLHLHQSIGLLCCSQEKYTRVMRDKAELTDKADQLEHLVVQLQGETDTIGKWERWTP